jgi:hypothetical protein
VTVHTHDHERTVTDEVPPKAAQAHLRSVRCLDVQLDRNWVQFGYQLADSVVLFVVTVSHISQLSMTQPQALFPIPVVAVDTIFPPGTS